MWTKEKQREYDKNNRDKINKRRRDRRHGIPLPPPLCSDPRHRGRELLIRRKKQFLSLYGGRCECCFESNSIFLAVDHVHGQVGKKKKETGYKAYSAACREYRPDVYRILCHNCNMAIRFGRTCPHQYQSDFQI